MELGDKQELSKRLVEFQRPIKCLCKKYINTYTYIDTYGDACVCVKLRRGVDA